jgi:hypothetical protein
METLQRDGMPTPVALALAFAVGLGIVASTVMLTGRTYKPSVLRFIRAIPVSAQGGVAGRSAALGLPRAPRSEVVAELKKAIEDMLAARMSMDIGLPGNRLVETAGQLGILAKDEIADLSRLMGDLRKLEEALAGGGRSGEWAGRLPILGAWRAGKGVRTADIETVSVRVQAMLRHLSEDLRSPADTGPRAPAAP